MARNSLWGSLPPPWAQSVPVVPVHLGRESRRCYRKQLAQKRLPLLPRPVSTFCSVSTAQSYSTSALLQTRRVEGRTISFPHTMHSKTRWPQRAKQSLQLYLALAHSVMLESAWCCVSGGAAQAGDRLQLKTGRLGLCLLGRTVQSESKAAKPAEQQRWSYRRKVVVSISQLSGNTCMCPGIHVYVHFCLLNIINSSVVLVVVPPPPQHLDSRANQSHFSVCCSLPCRCRMGTSRSVIGRDVAPAAETAPAAGRCKAGCPREH